MKSIPLMRALLLIGFNLFSGCGANNAQDQAESKSFGENIVTKTAAEEKTPKPPAAEKPKIIFIELGSVNCIPCRMMQPVMKSVEEKYGDQIRVVFYDVWKPDQRHYAQQYGIRVIPTQVFLDSTDQEIFRHEGFYPEEELDKFLQNNGLVILNQPEG